MSAGDFTAMFEACASSNERAVATAQLIGANIAELEAFRASLATHDSLTDEQTAFLASRFVGLEAGTLVDDIGPTLRVAAGILDTVESDQVEHAGVLDSQALLLELQALRVRYAAASIRAATEVRRRLESG